MEPPVWGVQTLTNAYACRATEGAAVRLVRDQLQLMNTNGSLSENNQLEVQNATTEEHHTAVLQLWASMEVVMCPRGPAAEDESHLDVLSCVSLKKNGSHKLI